ncbi:MAG: M56 family metallopeptidase [Candidatus Eremiobacteraeota bacterium]|nr:M56 family metallopeptidase [Candidatus Eremiobacteraeota bacterium]
MIVERIIAALFNATWQSVAIAGLVGIGLRAFGRTSASVRCAVWTAVLFTAVVLPVVDFAGAQSIKAPAMTVASASVHANAPMRLASTAATGLHAAIHPIANRSEPTPVRFSLATGLQHIAQGAFALWIAGMLVFGVRFLYQITCLLVAKRAVEPIESQTFHHATPGSRAVRLGISDRVAVPCLLGFFSPVIALPRVLAVELSAPDLERIVLHERAHLERRDDWFNLLEQIALVVLFFNPAMHYVARCIGVEREIACDDRVIAKSANRIPYAECLAHLARRCCNRDALTVPGFFTNRRQILVRVERLLDRGHNGSPKVGSKAFGAIGIIGAAGLFLSQLGIPVVAGVACTGQKTPLQLRSAASHLAQAVPMFALAPLPLRHLVIQAQAKRVPVKLAPPHLHAAASAMHFVTKVVTRVVAHVRVATAAVQRRRVRKIAPAIVAYASETSARAPGVAAVSASAVAVTAPVQQQDGGSDAGTPLAGYRGLSVDQLIELHDHGVTPEMIAEFKRIGYVNLAPSQLEQLRDHAVSAAYAKSMNALTKRALDVETLVRLRDHGVSTRFSTQMDANGMHGLSPDALIELFDHGVSPDYLASLARVGYSEIAVADAIRLRDRGVSATFIAHIRRDVNPGAVTIDELIRLRDAGI